MEETVIVIMLKDKNTGFLEKEFVSFKLPEFENYIVNIYAEENNSKKYICMQISTNKDVENWEFNAIYDYYDDGIFFGEIKDITELQDCYNPTWKVVFENADDLEEKIYRLLKIHTEELVSVYEVIAGKEEEYRG